ncbi:MAG: arsenate reductase-like glutaredoxin family protein [bacterium]|jgi:arsenate reductase-like glutaredoxin family protein
MKKIDWVYFRKNCTTCKKAQEFLGEREIEVVIDARKERFTPESAWDLVKSAQKISVTRGSKKIVTFSPSEDEKEQILKVIIGPSGNLRAPTYRIGEEFVVGFNPELYQDIFC